MKLKAWFDITPMTRTEFAEKLGVHFSQVYRWTNGDARPRWELARKIQDLTDGAVRLDDWVDR